MTYVVYIIFKAVICSTFIPLFSGILPPFFRGTRYVDGGFTGIFDPWLGA